MNSLLVLLVATSTTAADPQPMPVPSTAPIITYTESDWSDSTQPERPRLFGRVRNYVKTKWSHLTDRWNGNDTPETVTSGTYVVPGTISTPVAVPSTNAPRRMIPVRGDSSPEPPLADPIPTSSPPG